MKNKIFGLLLIITVVFTFGCDKEEDKQLKLKDDLNVEINSELKLYSLIEDFNGIDVVTEDYLIDTSKLGEKEINLKYKIKDDEYEGSFKINIVDREKPTIVFKEELSTYEGTSIDLLQNVSAIDNSKENIKVTVEGLYDFTKEGVYELKYIAVDSSNNRAEESFKLNVNKKEEPTTTNDNTTTNNTNNDNSNKTSSTTKTTTPTNTTYKAIGSSKVYYGKYKLEADTEDFKGTLILKSDGTVSTSGYTYVGGRLVKKNLTGTWTLKSKTISGIYGGKVDGIYFTWSNGGKTTFGIYNKFFGNNEVDYKWISK